MMNGGFGMVLLFLIIVFVIIIAVICNADKNCRDGDCYDRNCRDRDCGKWRGDRSCRTKTKDCDKLPWSDEPTECEDDVTEECRNQKKILIEKCNSRSNTLIGNTNTTPSVEEGEEDDTVVSPTEVTDNTVIDDETEAEDVELPKPVQNSTAVTPNFEDTTEKVEAPVLTTAAAPTFVEQENPEPAQPDEVEYTDEVPSFTTDE